MKRTTIARAVAGSALLAGLAVAAAMISGSSAATSRRSHAVIKPSHFVRHITNQYLQEFAARYYQFGGTDSIRTTDVDPIGGGVPRALSLSQNYPNPFDLRTSIVYALPVREKVTLALYDVLGREVRTLVRELQGPGSYRVALDASALRSGVYFAKLVAGPSVRQRKILLLR